MVEKLKEQIYVIPLDDVKHTPRWERSKRSVKAVRDFLAQHMKSEDIKLDPGISRKLWERGAHKPPARIRVRAMKFEDGQVQAEAAEE
jgi:large subunit ribosomal protein L31e